MKLILSQSAFLLGWVLLAGCSKVGETSRLGTQSNRTNRNQRYGRTNNNNNRTNQQNQSNRYNNNRSRSTVPNSSNNNTQNQLTSTTNGLNQNQLLQQQMYNQFPKNTMTNTSMDYYNSGLLNTQFLPNQTMNNIPLDYNMMNMNSSSLNSMYVPMNTTMNTMGNYQQVNNPNTLTYNNTNSQSQNLMNGTLPYPMQSLMPIVTQNNQMTGQNINNIPIQTMPTTIQHHSQNQTQNQNQIQTQTQNQSQVSSLNTQTNLNPTLLQTNQLNLNQLGNNNTNTLPNNTLSNMNQLGNLNLGLNNLLNLNLPTQTLLALKGLQSNQSNSNLTQLNTMPQQSTVNNTRQQTTRVQTQVTYPQQMNLTNTNTSTTNTTNNTTTTNTSTNTSNNNTNSTVSNRNQSLSTQGYQNLTNNVNSTNSTRNNSSSPLNGTNINNLNNDDIANLNRLLLQEQIRKMKSQDNGNMFFFFELMRQLLKKQQEEMKELNKKLENKKSKEKERNILEHIKGIKGQIDSLTKQINQDSNGPITTTESDRFTTGSPSTVSTSNSRTTSPHNTMDNVSNNGGLDSGKTPPRIILNVKTQPKRSSIPPKIKVPTYGMNNRQQVQQHSTHLSNKSNHMKQLIKGPTNPNLTTKPVLQVKDPRIKTYSVPNYSQRNRSRNSNDIKIQTLPQVPTHQNNKRNLPYNGTHVHTTSIDIMSSKTSIKLKTKNQRHTPNPMLTNKVENLSNIMSQQRETSLHNNFNNRLYESNRNNNYVQSMNNTQNQKQRYQRKQTQRKDKSNSKTNNKNQNRRIKE